jgi:hypothetical protein
MTHHKIVKGICYEYETKSHRCKQHNEPKPKSKKNQGKRTDLK